MYWYLPVLPVAAYHDLQQSKRTVHVKPVVEKATLFDSSELQGLYSSYYLHDCCIKSTEMIYWPEDIDMTGS